MAGKKIVRVALLGAESTGKSTLAAALAEHYGTVWVPEYLREFVETTGRTPQEHEQFLIASTQVAYENAAARKACAYLFCDTTPLMTALYSQFYFGRVDVPLQALADEHAYDFTIVTAPSGPWMPDGLQRESEAVRDLIHAQLLDVLNARDVRYLLVEGDVDQRIRQINDYLPACD